MKDQKKQSDPKRNEKERESFESSPKKTGDRSPEKGPRTSTPGKNR